ncbi:hypothetical protein [Desulfobulbus propionicus]
MAVDRKLNPRRDKNVARLRSGPLWLLVFFLGLLVVGIALDEPGRVLEQAKSVCLACIGIG